MDNIEKIIDEEIEAFLDEKKKKKKKKKKKAKKKKADRCTRIAKRKYDVWPSAYASGAVVRCRRGEIWKGVKEDLYRIIDEEIEACLDEKKKKARTDYSKERKTWVKNSKGELVPVMAKSGGGKGETIYDARFAEVLFNVSTSKE